MELNIALINDYLDAREATAEADAKARECKKQEDKLASDVTAHLSETGVQNLKLRGQTVYLTENFGCSGKKERRAELVKWAEENGLVDMIALNPASLRSYAKELILGESGEGDGPGLPEGLEALLTIYRGPKVAVRKG